MKNVVLKLMIFSLFPIAAFAEECSVVPECAEIGFPYTAAQCANRFKLKCPFGEGYFCSSCDNSQGFYDTCPDGAKCSERNDNGCVAALGCGDWYAEEGDGDWDGFDPTGEEYEITYRLNINGVAHVYTTVCLEKDGCRSGYTVDKNSWERNYKEWFTQSDSWSAGTYECISRDGCNTANGYYHTCPSNMTSVGTKTFVDGYTCHKCRCNSGYNANNDNYQKIVDATNGHTSNGCYIPDECDMSNNWVGSSNGDQVGEDGNNYDFEDKARELYEIDDTVSFGNGYCYHVTGCLDGLNSTDKGVVHEAGPGKLGDLDFACYTVSGCDNANDWFYIPSLSDIDLFSYSKPVTGNDGYNGTYSCRKVNGCSAYASSNPGTTSPYLWEKETKGNYTCYRQQACNATQGYYPLIGGSKLWYCPSGSSTTSAVTPASSPSPYLHCGKCQGSNFGTKLCTDAGFYASQAACIKNGSNNCRQVYGTNCWAPIGNQCATDRQTLFNNGLKGYVYENLYTGSVLDLTSSDPCPNGCGIRGDYLDSNQKPLVECDEEGNMQCRNRYHAYIQCSEAVSSWDMGTAPVKFKKVCSGSTCCASIDWSDIQTRLTQCHNAGGDFEEMYIEKDNPINVNSL